MAKVTVRNESGKVIELDALKAVLNGLLTHKGIVAAVDVLITDDQAMRQLNAEFRGLDEATDVLTFPGPDFLGAPLGDIAVSYEFAAKGAASRGVSLEEELAYLVIHGGLHLLGWDDETEAERVAMVAEMNRVATLLGLTPDPDWASQPHTD